jgi:hypothetical protein
LRAKRSCGIHLPMRRVLLVLMAACSPSSRPATDEAVEKPPAAHAMATPQPQPQPQPLDTETARALGGCRAIKIVYTPIRREINDAENANGPAIRHCHTLLADPAKREAARAVAKQRCVAGDARACYVLGGLHGTFIPRVGIGLDEFGGNLDRLAYVADPLTGEKVPVPSEAELAQSMTWFAKACELGDADGCARGLIARAEASKDPTPLVEHACKGGDPYACALARDAAKGTRRKGKPSPP